MATLGENRVRAGFNPSKSDEVEYFKSTTSRLIDHCEGGKKKATALNSEGARLFALAQTAYEEACMYAVKAATQEEYDKENLNA